MQKNLKDVFGNVHGLDEKSVEFLTKALSKNNLPGFDYLEFVQSLRALSAMNMDEETAIKSAFATASTVGLTKDKLVQSANHYKNVLSNERTQFEQALQNQLNKRVKGKQQEVEKLKGQIAKWKAQIQKLEEQVAKSQHTIDNADALIQEEMNKIESTKDAFEFTFQSIANQIDRDVENVNLYL
jgi:chromosome segregation ATPase